MVQQSDLLRLALVMSGSATNFRTKLGKMVELVLFDDPAHSASLDDIIQKTHERFELHFSVTEIQEAIQANSKRIVRAEENRHFALTPSAVASIRQSSTNNSFSKVVQRFLEARTDCPFDETAFYQLVLDYLYATFNSDVNTVLALLDANPKSNGNSGAYDSLSPEQIEWLNAFLSWNDPTKNRLVFYLISTCYDYCLMTVKKNNLPEIALFRGKEFYLDSNIIFRLAGINDRGYSDCVKAFVRKCKDVNVTLRYTNFTYDEVRRTIDAHVHKLQSVYGGKQPVRVEVARLLASSRHNWDFYSQYLVWLKQPGNKVGEFTEFKAYLMHRIDSCLKAAKYAQGESVESKVFNDSFKNLCSELYGYKLQHKHDSPMASIKTDVENYLYIMELDKQSPTNTFLNKKAFFITADRRYINWVKQKLPGALPIFVQPEVWYSLILKYKGRADNDYAAFCQFMSISPHIQDDDSPEGLDKKKLLMLERVSSLDEATSVKERIIYDIDRRLHEPNVAVEDVEAFVEESKEKVTREIVAEELAKQRAELLQQQQAGDAALRALLEQQQEEARIKTEQETEAAMAEGKQIAIQMMVDKETKRILKRNKAIRIIALLIAAVASLVLIGVIALSLLKRFGGASGAVNFVAGKEPFITVASIVLAVPFGIIGLLAKQVDALSTDEETLKKRISEKIQEQMDS